MKDQNNDKNAKAGYVPDTVRSSKYRSYKKKLETTIHWMARQPTLKGGISHR